MTKKYCLLIICIIALAIMFLIARGLTKEVPAHMLDIQCEKTLKNEIVVNCSAIASSDIYAKHEIVIENNEAYIKVFYYAIPFLRNTGSGDFSVTIDTNRDKIKRVFVLNQDDNPFEVPIKS